MSRFTRSIVQRIAPQQHHQGRRQPPPQRQQLSVTLSASLAAPPPPVNHALAALQRINIHDIRRENARDVMRTVHETQFILSQEDITAWQETARKLLKRVLAQGFATATPEVIRPTSSGTLMIATLSREDSIGPWTTQYYMWLRHNQAIDLTDCIILVPYPSPRPLDWIPGSERSATTIHEHGIVLIDPRLLLQ